MAPIETGVKVPPETATTATGVTPDGDPVKRVDSSSKRPRSRKADSPPKAKAEKPPTAASPFTTRELEQALAEILTFPAVPCAMVGDEWAATHFSTQGAAFAATLTQQAEKNAALHKWCVRIAQGESMGMLGIAAVMYMVPPLIHWGIVPMPAAVRDLPGMPPSPEPEQGTTTAEQAGAPMPGSGNNGSNGNTTQQRHTP